MIRRRLLQTVFSLLYGPLAPMHELVGQAAFGPAWPGRRRALLDWLSDSTGLLVDLGCGEGRLLTEVTKRGLTAVGVEPSPAMTRRARRRGVTVVRGESGNLPLRNGAVDAVIATYPGPWIVAPRTWREIDRVLRPGGVVLILLGGTTERGRLTTARRLVSGLVYGRRGDYLDLASLPQLGSSQISGSWRPVSDRWGTALIWDGRRAGTSGD